MLSDYIKVSNQMGYQQQSLLGQTVNSTDSMMQTGRTIE